MEELQKIRQQEEEERLEGLSGMSWKEKGIGYNSSAGPELPRLAEGTHGCTAQRTEWNSCHRGPRGIP